jgi:CRISPR-associated protein Csx14
MSFAVKVDPTNPGQFFACCGLLELADRLWPGAEGWFADGQFCVDRGALGDVLAGASKFDFQCNDEDEAEEEEDGEVEEEEGPVKPLVIEAPIQLRLDWWSDKEIKTWAGSMNVAAIALAMSRAICVDNADPFNQCEVVYDPPKPTNGRKKAAKKKREPFYFDSRRGPNAHSRDVGFSPNDLKIKTEAVPVVELLCLVGLQRARILEYFTWAVPLKLSVITAVVAGHLPGLGCRLYRFANQFRSGQKKMKAYHPATPLE